MTQKRNSQNRIKQTKVSRATEEKQRLLQIQLHINRLNWKYCTLLKLLLSSLIIYVMLSSTSLNVTRILIIYQLIDICYLILKNNSNRSSNIRNMNRCFIRVSRSRVRRSRSRLWASCMGLARGLGRHVIVQQLSSQEQARLLSIIYLSFIISQSLINVLASLSQQKLLESQVKLILTSM